jgi:hypothetical protein
LVFAVRQMREQLIDAWRHEITLNLASHQICAKQHREKAIFKNVVLTFF